MKSEIKRGLAVHCFVPVLICAFAILVCFSPQANGQSADELYIQANQSYKAKQFRQAAEDYEKLIEQGYTTGEIYYNLGNCYYKMDSIGKCILSYERALKLSPKDEDILHNLKLAKLRSIDNIQPVPQLAIITWWNDFVSFNSSKGWSIFALIAIWLFIVLFAAFILVGRRRIFKISALTFLFISFLSLMLAIHQHQQERKSDTAIVMASSTYVKSAPDAGAGDLFMIHEGTRIQILDQVDEWNKIRLEDGKVGWVKKESFERI